MQRQSPIRQSSSFGATDKKKYQRNKTEQEWLLDITGSEIAQAICPFMISKIDSSKNPGENP